MMGRQSGQVSMVILDIAELIPRDHLLRKINQMVSFDFIYDLVAPYYTWKKVRKVLPLSGEDAGAPAGQRNCQARWKKICWPRSSDCAQRTLT